MSDQYSGDREKFRQELIGDLTLFSDGRSQPTAFSLQINGETPSIQPTADS